MHVTLLCALWDKVNWNFYYRARGADSAAFHRGPFASARTPSQSADASA